MSIQTKSDVIRVFLLHDHGGVWADATVCMTQRLPRLFHENVDFNTFIRYRQSSPDWDWKKCHIIGCFTNREALHNI